MEIFRRNHFYINSSQFFSSSPPFTLQKNGCIWMDFTNSPILTSIGWINKSTFVTMQVYRGKMRLSTALCLQQGWLGNGAAHKIKLQVWIQRSAMLCLRYCHHLWFSQPYWRQDMSTPEQIYLTTSNKTSNNIYQKQARMICLMFPQEFIYITRDYASFIR